ncbi:MAG TPA: 1-deoxy-D-xylulose-5-phosphate reductoisomerase [Burkholderiaceae bacterium]
MSYGGAARQGISILGATGSIGASTLGVLAQHPGLFRVVALTAHSKVDALVDLCRRFEPELAAIADERLIAPLADGLRKAGLRTLAAGGSEGLVRAARLESADCVVAAIVGAAGLNATLAAARSGKRLLLANKEAIVCAGSLLLEAVHKSRASLLPVDSEHNAIHQCLAAARDTNHAVQRLILTASGGPFLRRTDLAGVTPEQACAHPKWNMGRKISVDSATLMNKGLEVIEASWLFGFTPDRIDVVIHPQSVIHSMVEFVDGSVLAQMGTPDMRTPIAYALGFPQRISSGSPRLDLLKAGPLQFEAPDQNQFPCLRLAYQALRTGPAACIVLNAANEVAVDSFLKRELPFARIPAVIEEALARGLGAAPESIEAVIELDQAARRQTQSILAKNTWTS